MRQELKNALVPAVRRLTGSALGARGAQRSGGAPEAGEFQLVRHQVHLQDTKKVEKHLPDILGRALARGWIDKDFRLSLMRSPKQLLANYGVFLPDNITIRTETTENQRQRIVVYEAQPGGKQRRLLYLQLVMMAGK